MLTNTCILYYQKYKIGIDRRPVDRKRLSGDTWNYSYDWDESCHHVAIIYKPSSGVSYKHMDEELDCLIKNSY